MRKAVALVIVLLLMALVLASPAARARGPARVVTLCDTETESPIGALADPVFRAARQPSAIDAFGTTGNRHFARTMARGGRKSGAVE